MNGYNHVVLMGNLAKDPEAKYTQSGTCITSFPLAVNRKVKGKDGEWKDDVDFINIKVFGKMGEACEKYLSKGSPAMIEGRISVSNYDDKNGNRVWRTDIIASTVNFLGNKSDGGNNNSNSSYSAPKKSKSDGLSKDQMDNIPQSFRDEYMDVSNDGDEDVDLPF